MTTLRELVAMTRTVLRSRSLAPQPPGTRDSIGARVAANARAHGGRVALLCEGETLTWRDLNQRANRVAHALAADGVGRGDVVALLMENRTDFLTVLLGITKLGAIASLINTNQRNDVLLHSLTATGARRLVAGAELADAVRAVRTRLPPTLGAVACVPDGERPLLRDAAVLDPRAEGRDDDPDVTADIRVEDACFHIFTSGTTGLPKAAIVSNGRLLKAMTGYGYVCLDMQPDDRVYNCLPLYHSTSLIVGFGACLYAGSSMVLRRRFSASAFLGDVRTHACTTFVYVGELCRYLMAQPAAADDAANPLTAAIGNGLRPDIWKPFKARFGIGRVFEIYGASEGNSGFVNAFNKDETIGFGVDAHVLVRYDVAADAIVRGAGGLCERVARGEPGLLLIEVSNKARFDGYTNRAASEAKLVRDVLRRGDVHFNTGDLVRQVDVGFAFFRPHYQFVDRTGDTFRWKGENCSTNEVAEAINAFPQVATANVYGVQVPHADGRAGMAAITLDPHTCAGVAQLDWAGLAAHIDARLPAYARPVFIRIVADHGTTTTFKLVKNELREQAFWPDRTGGDPVWVRRPGSAGYEPLTAGFVAAIEAGSAGY
jgi:citronellyl-CoA synthetase